MPLTPDKRKKLRSMANTMKAIMIVGKDNVSDDVVAQANEALEARELIKVSILETSELTTREAADELAARTHSETVQVIGRKFVLYRKSCRKGVKHIEF